MTELELLIQFHLNADRQGPSGSAETQRAIALAGLDPEKPLAIADIGCGTGASTLELVKHLNATVTAVDCMPAFIRQLKNRLDEQALADQVRLEVASMTELPFENEAFDVIWSEGAIYNMGFEAGISAWRRLLKPGGILAVSEITWLTAQRPLALEQYWQQAYPEIACASSKIAQLEKQGYRLKAYFILPTHCWLDNYYEPMEARFSGFLQTYACHHESQKLVECERQEIALYRQYQDYYSYGFYIAEKC